MKISGVDIRPGNILEYEGGIWKVAKIQHTQPGKGGGSTGDEEGRDREIEKGIHVRVPTFLGSVENVFELDQFHKYYGEDDE